MIVSGDALTAKHQKYVLSPWLAQGALAPPVIVRGEGIYLYDDAGNRYADLTSGLVAVNLGHGHPAVLRAMHAQIDRLCFSPPNWFNDARAELGEALLGLAPWADEGGRVFFSTSGAAANEDAIKFARVLTGRTKVLSGYRSFHGSGSGAATLTGENRRWYNEPNSVIGGVVHFWTPFPYRSPFFTTDPAEETQRALQHVADVVAAENAASVAAIIVETVVGSNGVIVYPPGYLAGLRALCDAHGILLIFDEVITAFGRLGHGFAAERYGAVPDMITFAKGVTNGAVPLGGVIVRDGIYDAFMDGPAHAIELFHGHTYSGHPLACAAGLATLDLYRDEALFARGLRLEPFLEKAVHTLKDAALVTDIRNVGLAAAIDLEPDGAAPGRRGYEAMCLAFSEENLIVRVSGDTIVLAPALVATESEIAHMVEGVRAVLWRLR